MENFLDRKPSSKISCKKKSFCCKKAFENESREVFKAEMVGSLPKFRLTKSLGERKFIADLIVKSVMVFFLFNVKGIELIFEKIKSR